LPHWHCCFLSAAAAVVVAMSSDSGQLFVTSWCRAGLSTPHMMVDGILQ